MYDIHEDFKLSEKEYRKYPYLSKSDLTFFAKQLEETNSIKDSYKNLLDYKNGVIKTPDNPSFKFGRIIDTLITNPNGVDGYIFVEDGIRNNEQVKNLFRTLKMNGYNLGDDLTKYVDIYNAIYSAKPTKVAIKSLNNLYNNNLKYLEILFKTNFICEIISSKEWDRANKTIDGLSTLDNYIEIFEGNVYFQIPMMRKLKIEDIEPLIPMKGLADIIYFDDATHCHLRDLKTTGMNIGNFEESIIKYTYDLQLLIYKKLLEGYGFNVVSVGLIAVETNGLFRSKEYLLYDNILMNSTLKNLQSRLKILMQAKKAYYSLQNK